MECSLCLNEFECYQRKPFTVNPCGHYFCLSYLNKIENKKCSNCRGTIESSTLNRGILDILDIMNLRGISKTGELKKHECKSEATFQLIINDFSKFRLIENDQKKIIISQEPCIVKNLPWKILALTKLIKPRGECFLGFFLQCNAESDSNEWSVVANAELRILHKSDSKKNLVKKIQHRFHLEENDWGFSPFAYMKDILDPERGLYDQNKDSVTLEVWLNADEPTHHK